jgi:hypothetical protein
MIRKAYLKKTGERLEDLEDDISRLREKAEKMESEARRKFQDTLEVLRYKQESSRERIEDLRAAAAGDWGRFKGGVEESLADLKRAVDHAVERFRKIA